MSGHRLCCRLGWAEGTMGVHTPLTEWTAPIMHGGFRSIQMSKASELSDVYIRHHHCCRRLQCCRLAGVTLKFSPWTIRSQLCGLFPYYFGQLCYPSLSTDPYQAVNDFWGSIFLCIRRFLWIRNLRIHLPSLLACVMCVASFALTICITEHWPAIF